MISYICLLTYFLYFQLEDDLSALQKKYAHLENEFDNANEGLTEAKTKLENSDKKATEVSTYNSRS